MGRSLTERFRRILPRKLRRRLSALGSWPPRGGVRFGSLRRLEPISRRWGIGRGTPIDRYCIREFLGRCSADIRGHVLELGAGLYARDLAGDRLTRRDVLRVAGKSVDVTVVGHLTDPTLFPPDTFDCIITTQTLSSSTMSTPRSGTAVPSREREAPCS